MIEDFKRIRSFDDSRLSDVGEAFRKAQEMEAQGNKRAAADFYVKGGSPFKAIRLYEDIGDAEAAYKIAISSNDKFTADRLAVKYQIANHEFSDFPNMGDSLEESMSLVLKSRLAPGATAERFGFNGFANKIVADIGARDGRFITLFRSLGAAEVYGIEPDKQALDEVVRPLK